MPRIIWGYDPKCGSLLWWFSPCRGLRPRGCCPSPTKGVKIQSPKTEIRKGLIQQCNSNTTNHNNNNNSNSDSNEQSKIATKYSSLKHDVQNHECTALPRQENVTCQDVTSAWYLNNPARAPPPTAGET